MRRKRRAGQGVGQSVSAHGRATHSVRSRYQHSLAGQLAKDARLLDEYLTASESGTLVRLREAS